MELLLTKPVVVTLAVAVFGWVGSGVSDVTDAVLPMVVPVGVDAGTNP